MKILYIVIAIIGIVIIYQLAKLLAYFIEEILFRNIYISKSLSLICSGASLYLAISNPVYDANELFWKYIFLNTLSLLFLQGSDRIVDDYQERQYKVTHWYSDGSRETSIETVSNGGFVGHLFGSLILFGVLYYVIVPFCHILCFAIPIILIIIDIILFIVDIRKKSKS